MRDPGTLRFLIVGTGRSGTTLVQRLCCELSTVWVPQETHYWPLALQGAYRFEYPLRGPARAEFTNWVLTELQEHNLPVTPKQVMDEVWRRDRRVGLFHIFESLVAALSPERSILGEKTPEHLLWWEHLTTAQQHLKLIAIVRDPRAVLASQRTVPWGEHDVFALAERWLTHQRAIVDAGRLLGEQRCLILRYEDVVVRPDAYRNKIAEFLGVSTNTTTLNSELLDDYPLFPARETWKSSAIGEVTTERVGAWTALIDASELAVIEKITSELMTRFGYDLTSGEVEPLEPDASSEARVAAYRAYYQQIIGLAGLPIY